MALNRSLPVHIFLFIKNALCVYYLLHLYIWIATSFFDCVEWIPNCLLNVSDATHRQRNIWLQLSSCRAIKLDLFISNSCHEFHIYRISLDWLCKILHRLVLHIAYYFNFYTECTKLDTYNGARDSTQLVVGKVKKETIGSGATYDYGKN